MLAMVPAVPVRMIELVVNTTPFVFCGRSQTCYLSHVPLAEFFPSRPAARTRKPSSELGVSELCGTAGCASARTLSLDALIP